MIEDYTEEEEVSHGDTLVEAVMEIYRDEREARDEVVRTESTD